VEGPALSARRLVALVRAGARFESSVLVELHDQGCRVSAIAAEPVTGCRLILVPLRAAHA